MNLKTIAKRHREVKDGCTYGFKYREFKHGWTFAMNITRVVVALKIADIEKEKGSRVNRLLNQRAIKHLNELEDQIRYVINEREKFLISLSTELETKNEGKENAESRQSSRN